MTFESDVAQNIRAELVFPQGAETGAVQVTKTLFDVHPSEIAGLEVSRPKVRSVFFGRVEVSKRGVGC